MKVKHIEPDSVRDRILSELEQERCDVCTFRWPASMMTIEDGLHVCPNDVDTTTASWKADIEEKQAAWVAQNPVRPQDWPVTREAVVAVTGMTRTDGTRVTPSNPLDLAASGAAKDLICAGVGLSSADTVTASTGITVSVTVDSTTQVTLSVTAGAIAAGNYHLTYNGTTYRGIFRVR